MTKTAIILFADLPDFEVRAKSFCDFSSKKATRKVSAILTHHFHKLAKTTTATTFLIDTFQQKGNSFGEKITNAFAYIYAKGFENVICIGNDCPDLDLQSLQNSIRQVEAGNIVLGPTFDGGAYLIGIPKHKFSQQSFLQIKWQSKQTFQGLKSSFHNEVIELTCLADVDSEKDFAFSSSNNYLVKRLLNTISSFKPTFVLNFNIQKHSVFLVDFSFLKGPPLLSV